MPPKIVTSILRPAPETVARLRLCYSAVVLDQRSDQGLLDPHIKPLASGMRVCGPAITCSGADLQVRRMAIDIAQPGDVIVVAAGGRPDRACFGGATARLMMAKGLAGIVIDGAARDSLEIRQLGFPTFVLGITALNFEYPIDIPEGGVNVPVTVGGQALSPGDLVLGDDDGVIVIPRAEADSRSTEFLQHMRNKDVEYIKRLDRPYDVRQSLADRGFSFE